MRIRWILALAAAAFAAASTVQADEKTPEAKPAPAEPAAEAKPEAEKPKGPTMDELSKKTLAAYREKVFDLSDQKIEKASFRVKLAVPTPMGPMELTGGFRMEDGKATMTWDDPQAGMMVGDLTGQFARFLRTETDEERFGTSKLTAKKEEDGRVVVSVEGENPRGFRRLEFDGEGILTKVATAGMGEEIESEIRHAEFEGHLVQSGQRTEGALGVQDNKIEFGKAGEFVVPVRIVIEQEAMGGSTVIQLDFTEWKLNDDVKAEAETAEEPEPPALPVPAPDDESE